MPQQKAPKARLDPMARQRRIYSAVIIILSACIVLSMILQMVMK
jgi:hypothetical protein